MQESDKEELMARLASREKQIADMAEMLAELSEQLNSVFYFACNIDLTPIIDSIEESYFDSRE